MKQQETKETKQEKKTGGKGESYSIYPIEVVVFNGDKGVNVTISKRYRTKEGEFEKTSSFNLSDLSTVKTLIDVVLNDQTSKREFDY